MPDSHLGRGRYPNLPNGPIESKQRSNRARGNGAGVLTSESTLISIASLLTGNVVLSDLATRQDHYPNDWDECTSSHTLHDPSSKCGEVCTRPGMPGSKQRYSALDALSRVALFQAVQVQRVAAEEGMMMMMSELFVNGEKHPSLTAEFATQTFTLQSAPMTTVTPADASTPIEEDLAGKVAVIDRGEVTFVQKAKAAQDKGAIAVIIVNSDDELQGLGEAPGFEEISIYVCCVSNIQNLNAGIHSDGPCCRGPAARYLHPPTSRPAPHSSAP